MSTKWMVFDSMMQTYGPFDSYDLANEELEKRGWFLLKTPEFSFSHVLTNKDGHAYLYAKIMIFREMLNVDDIPTS